MLRSLLRDYQSKQDAMFGTTLIAPALVGDVVVARLHGLVWRFKTLDIPEELTSILCAWTIVSESQVRYLRPATALETLRYLDALPTCPLIYLGGDYHSALLAVKSQNVPEVYEANAVSLLFAIPPMREIQHLDVIRCGFDGTNFFYASPLTTFTRQSIKARQLLLADSRDYQSLPGQFIRAIELIKWRQEEEAREAQAQAELSLTQKIDAAVQKAGGSLISTKEYSGTVDVTYRVNGRTFNSLVNKSNLQVVYAGICLNRTDSQFDLTSLVTVVNEGVNRRKIVDVRYDPED